jgi:hypothetical protein
MTRLALVLTTALSIALLGGCVTAPPISTARFANRPPVWRVIEPHDVPTKPAERPFPVKLYFFDAFFYNKVREPLGLPPPRHALDVNAWDEVPDSSWFTNRIGVRDLTVEEVRRGPNRHEGPQPDAKWTIKNSKVGGGSAGFVIKDGRGDRYIVKFDEPHAPVTESATDVAVQRLLWALGYFVPENAIVYFRREDLELDPDAVVRDVFGNEEKMTWADVDKQLARSYRRPDGSYRALVSRYLDGIPIGGFPQRGVRKDDPNDTIPHEHRRSIRALYLLFGWVQQTDAKEDNTLDAWVEEAGGHRVRHFLVDFGKSFGTSAFIVNRPGDGHRENLDYPFIAKSLFSLGVWKLPYDGTPTPDIIGLGTFDAEHYLPWAWKPHADYAPFRYVDARDTFWAAKIMMRMTPELIRAAVEQGRYEDPRAVDYLVEVLVARQHKAARWAFSRLAALDRFRLDRDLETGGWRLCFDDLLIRYGLEPGAAATTRYQLARYDRQGRMLGEWVAADAGTDRTACRGNILPSGDHDGYAIIKIETERLRRGLPPVEVHVALDPAGSGLRIVGIHRP